MANRPDWITDVRFYSTEQQGNGPEARGSVTIANSVYINFVIWSGRDGGYQVQLPRTQNPKFNESEQASKTNKKYYEEVGCVNGEVREAITRTLVDQLIAERGTATPATNVNDASIPF